MKFIQLSAAGHTKVSVRADQITMIEPSSAQTCRILIGAGPALMDVMHRAEEVLALINGPAPATYDNKETALILAGLRLLQNNIDAGLPSSIDDILLDAWPREKHGDIEDAINDLCEKVNG